MDYWSLIPWSISALATLIAILSFLRTGNRNMKADILEDDAKLDGIKEGLLKANMKLDQVCATTNETRTDIKALNKDIANLEKEVVVLKRDLKTAFSRIDELRNMINTPQKEVKSHE